MSRAFDFVVVGVIITISILIHLIGITLFEPGTPLYEAAASADNLGGQAKADLWWQILSIYMPLASSGGIIAWAVLREYRRQAVTATQPLR